MQTRKPAASRAVWARWPYRDATTLSQTRAARRPGTRERPSLPAGPAGRGRLQRHRAWSSESRISVGFILQGPPVSADAPGSLGKLGALMSGPGPRRIAGMGRVALELHHDPVCSRCCSSQGPWAPPAARPVPWLGVLSTGRWLSSFSMGTAAKSRVLRVLVSCRCGCRAHRASPAGFPQRGCILRS